MTVTLFDALVLARSWMHHSMAFRSVVVHGTARVVADPAERLAAMRALIDHIAPGRTADSREPTRKELAATAILAVELEQVSLKVRDDHVADDEDDLALPYWAGTHPAGRDGRRGQAQPGPARRHRAAGVRAALLASGPAGTRTDVPRLRGISPQIYRAEYLAPYRAHIR